MKYVISYNKNPDINSKRVLSEQYISSVLTLYQHSLYAPLSLSSQMLQIGVFYVTTSMRVLYLFNP